MLDIFIEKVQLLLDCLLHSLDLITSSLYRLSNLTYHFVRFSPNSQFAEMDFTHFITFRPFKKRRQWLHHKIVFCEANVDVEIEIFQKL